MTLAVVGRQPAAVVDALNDWIASQTPRTRVGYANAYTRARQFFPHVPLADVDEGLAAAVVDDLRRRYEPTTVHTTYYALRSLWSFLTDRHLVATNPWRKIRVQPPKNRRAERILTEEEVRRLVAAAANPRQAAFLRFLYAMGLRVSEAVSVTWRDIHEGAEGRYYLTVYGKGGVTRQVETPPWIYALLVLLRGEGRVAGERLWPFSDRRARQILTAVDRRAQLGKRPSPHWLRHAHATHALRHGASLVTVKHTLGHARLETTETYLHLEPGESSSTFVPQV